MLQEANPVRGRLLPRFPTYVSCYNWLQVLFGGGPCWLVSHDASSNARAKSTTSPSTVTIAPEESNAGRRVRKEKKQRARAYEEHTLHAAAATLNSQDPSGQTARSQSLGEGTSWSTSMYRSATALAPFRGNRHRVVVFLFTGS